MKRLCRMVQWFLAGLVFVVCACDGARDPATVSKPATIPDFLAGSSVRCMLDEECDTGACYQGRCAGVLTTDALWAQRLVGRRIIAKTLESPEFGSKIVATLRQALQDVERSPTQRSRIIALLALVDVDGDSTWLQKLVADSEPLVHLRVLEALANRGDWTTIQELSALARGKSEPLAMFATSAAGVVATAETVEWLSAIALSSETTHGARLVAVRNLSRWMAEVSTSPADPPVWVAKATDTLRKVAEDPTTPYLWFDARLGLEGTPAIK